jgi:hypothetical protein
VFGVDPKCSDNDFKEAHHQAKPTGFSKPIWFGEKDVDETCRVTRMNLFEYMFSPERRNNVLVVAGGGWWAGIIRVGKWLPFYRSS